LVVAPGRLVEEPSTAAGDEVLNALELCVDAVSVVVDADSERVVGVGVTVVAAVVAADVRAAFVAAVVAADVRAAFVAAVVAEDVCAPVVAAVDAVAPAVAAVEYEDKAGVGDDPGEAGCVDASFGVLVAKGLRGVPLPARKVGAEAPVAAVVAVVGSAASDRSGGEAGSAPPPEG